MTMAGYTKLFSKILCSSIWNENDKTRILWITMLAMCDQHGFVEGAPSSVAHQARISKEDFDKSIAVLESPDSESITSDYEGRRISKVEGGWLVLNYEKYRSKLMDTNENELARNRMRRHRAKLKGDTIQGEEEAELRNVTLDNFEGFWKVYPKRKAKGNALKAWLKHKPNIDKCLSTLEWQKKSNDWLKNKGQFVPYPASWINGECWNDEPTTATRTRPDGSPLLCL